MSACDSVCTAYKFQVIGAGGLHDLKTHWVKRFNNTQISWINFAEFSAKFGTDTPTGVIIAIAFKFVMPVDTEVATLRILDCNDNLVVQQSLVMGASISWKKWVVTNNFGSSCSYDCHEHSQGIDTMPPNPPPLQ